jgi:hypothetical protein
MKKGSGKGESRREHNPIKTVSEEAATLASSLAPLEEQENGERKAQSGAIRLDTGKLEVPKGFIEEDKGDDGFGLDRAVLLIMALALAFIAFIAYLISVEPQR